MTKKDYVILAAAIKRTLEGIPDGPNKRDPEQHPRIGVVWTAQTLAMALMHDNPRFDRERFLAACGL